MTKRFIIVLDTCTKEQEEAVRLSIKDLTWWHWLPNVWLLTDTTGAFSAITLRDHIRKAIPMVYILVFELNDKGDTWAGYGPSTEQRNMFDWIRRNFEQKTKS
jgi:hypothetical protein